MTSRNIRSLERAELNTQAAEPFLLRGMGMDYLWGGRRLLDDFGKEAAGETLAESWECSTHPDGVSLIASGVFEGLPLDEVLRNHPYYLGTHPIQKYGQDSVKSGQLPILIKLIDAKQNLSVQVHPDDAYAEKKEKGQLGKTEFWYVMEAVENAELIYGLHHDVGEKEMENSIREGTVEKYLRKVRARKNDIFMVEPGTIHAIGAGILLAEIQQNSNLTYRLYDYDRMDKNGQKRKLHIRKALEVANLSGNAAPRQPMRVLHYRQGTASESLCRCPYFQVARLLLNTERCRSMALYRTDSTSFRVLLCLEGCGSLQYQNESIYFFRGDCIFVPADSVPMRIHGKAQFLEVRV